MGYNTDFVGRIELQPDTTVAELSKIKGELKLQEVEDFYFALELSEDLLALVWTGDEKTYKMQQQIEHLVDVAGARLLDGPGFLCQGEDIEDRYRIRVANGRPEQVAVDAPVMQECPDCGHRWEAKS